MVVENCSMPTDWFPLGWNRVLPPQDFPLVILVATATVNDLDGDLDELLDQTFGDRQWHLLGDHLDSLISWTGYTPPGKDVHPDDIARGEQARHVFEEAMRAAERPLPTTVRDLAHLMAEFGIFVRSAEGKRWRMGEPLPLPAEVLPLPPEVVADLDHLRWLDVTETLAGRIISYVVDGLGRPPSVATSIGRLCRATGLDANDVRLGLARLIGDGEFSTTRVGRPVDPETLLEHARFVLQVDWAMFDRKRFNVRQGEDGKLVMSAADEFWERSGIEPDD